MFYERDPVNYNNYIIDKMDYLQIEYTNLIAALGEENFNLLIKEFNKEYFETKDVRIVNGSYDGGIDLEVHKENELIKRPIQITVQKSKLEEKLKGDLKKAKENSIKHGYAKTLDFYCTSSLSGDKKRAWKRLAVVDFGIELKLYDSQALAALADSFPIIKTTLFDILGIKKTEELINVDRHTKVLYDMFAIGKDAGELKRQFLHSLIITFIFEHPNCTENEIFEGLKQSLQENEQIPTILKSHIDSLRGKGIIILGAQKHKLELTPSKRNEIKELLDTISAQEGLLNIELQTCLLKYHLVPETKKIVDFIYKSFQANYEADLEELSGNSNHQGAAIKRIFSDLINYLTNKIKDSQLAEKAAREILDICTENEYLKKISASILFTKLFQSNKLETYINQKKQFLFLDTQILLRLICLDVNPNNIPDITMKSVGDLIKTVNKFSARIFLQTSLEYVNELTKQIVDALKLDRFFSLPIIQNMGGVTNNVIYNYFKTLQDARLYDSQLTIFDFVTEILDLKEIPSINSKEIYTVISNKIEHIFKYLNIEVINIPFTDEFLGIKREYEYSLNEKAKSVRAIENDVRTIMFLSDPEQHIDPKTGITNEPFLITWDKSFYNARKFVLKKYSSRSYWYIYTPSKFADRLSLQNFQLNPTAINNNIVSLTESNFNINSGTSFIDLMSSIFDSEDLTHVKIAHKLIRLEEMNKSQSEETASVEDQEGTALIRVLTELRGHYFKSEKFSMDDLVGTLENNGLVDEIYDIILKSVDSLKVTRQLKIDIFSEFDTLIEQNINDSQKDNKSTSKS